MDENKMNARDAMNIHEDEICNLIRARAVLYEVNGYLADKAHWEDLPIYAEHILLLLDTADSMIHDAIPQLEGLVDIVCELSKAEKAE